MVHRLLLAFLAAAAFAASETRTARAAAPDPPTNVVATAGNARATVTWSAPASDNGSPITTYIVAATGSSDHLCVPQTSALKCTVTRLANGTTYTFTVTAENADGSSPASAPSNAVIPAGQPGPPTNVIATAGDQEATVACTAPADDGGAPITEYIAVSSPQGKTASAPTCPITVQGLIDGKSYTFKVTAANDASKSVASAPSAAVTLVDTTPPTQPAGIRGAIEGGALVLSWTASTDNVRVVGYEVYLNGKPLVSVNRGTTASLRSFEPHGKSVYTVTAFDAARNQSMPSTAVIARATPLPRNVPRTVPAWTWKVLAWQKRGSTGTRPKAPTILPKWYAAWKQWRLTPFELVGS